MQSYKVVIVAVGGSIYTDNVEHVCVVHCLLLMQFVSNKNYTRASVVFHLTKMLQSSKRINLI